MRVLADASKHIEHFAPVWLRVLNAVGRQDRQSIGPGKIDKLPVGLFFATNEMPLNFHVNIFPPKYINQVGAIDPNRPCFCGGRRLACN